MYYHLNNFGCESIENMIWNLNHSFLNHRKELTLILSTCQLKNWSGGTVLKLVGTKNQTFPKNVCSNNWASKQSKMLHAHLVKKNSRMKSKRFWPPAPARSYKSLDSWHLQDFSPFFTWLCPNVPTTPLRQWLFLAMFTFQLDNTKR